MKPLRVLLVFVAPAVLVAGLWWLLLQDCASGTMRAPRPLFYSTAFAVATNLFVPWFLPAPLTLLAIRLLRQHISDSDVATYLRSARTSLGVLIATALALPAFVLVLPHPLPEVTADNMSRVGPVVGIVGLMLWAVASAQAVILAIAYHRQNALRRVLPSRLSGRALLVAAAAMYCLGLIFFTPALWAVPLVALVPLLTPASIPDVRGA